MRQNSQPHSHVRTVTRTLGWCATVCIAISFAACSSDDNLESSSSTVSSHTATVTASPATRAVLDEAGAIDQITPVLWEDGDKVYVFLDNGTDCVGTLELKSGSGQSTATFTGKLTVPDGAEPQKMQAVFKGVDKDDMVFDYSEQDASREHIKERIVLQGETDFSVAPVLQLSPKNSILKFAMDAPDGVTTSDLHEVYVDGTFSWATLYPTGEWYDFVYSKRIHLTGVTIENGKVCGYVSVVYNMVPRALQVVLVADKAVNGVPGGAKKRQAFATTAYAKTDDNTIIEPGHLVTLSGEMFGVEDGAVTFTNGEYGQTIDTYRLGRTEVTNAQFCAFLNACGVGPTGAFTSEEEAKTALGLADLSVIEEYTYGECLLTSTGGQQGNVGMNYDTDRGRWEPAYNASKRPAYALTWYGAMAFNLWYCGLPLPTVDQMHFANEDHSALHPEGNLHNSSKEEMNLVAWNYYNGQYSRDVDCPGSLSAPHMAMDNGLRDIYGNHAEWMRDTFSEQAYALKSNYMENSRHYVPNAQYWKVRHDKFGSNAEPWYSCRVLLPVTSD